MTGPLGSSPDRPDGGDRLVLYRPVRILPVPLLWPYLPQDAFTVREALDSFTVKSAEASFEENIKGRIAPGYMADFVVLDANPFDTEPRELHNIAVLACYLGGTQVYSV